MTLEERVKAALEEMDLPARVDRMVEHMQQETAQIEQSVAQWEVEKVAALRAAAAGALTSTMYPLGREAAATFELHNGELRAKRGFTDPGDPLVPLRFETWIEEVRKEKPFLFTAPAK